MPQFSIKKTKKLDNLGFLKKTNPHHLDIFLAGFILFFLNL